MKKWRRIIFQDKWFQQWFVRKQKILHERFIDYSWVLLNLGLDEGRVLDVGCGAAFFPLLLAILGFDVTAIDTHLFDYGFPQYEFKQGSATNIELDGEFDRIISMSAIEHFGIQMLKDANSDKEAIKHLRQYLKLDGQWLITVPFGKYAVFQGWRVYDQKRLNEMFPNIVKQDFFLREGVKPFFEKVSRSRVEGLVHLKGRPHAATTSLIAER